MCQHMHYWKWSSQPKVSNSESCGRSSASHPQPLFAFEADNLYPPSPPPNQFFNCFSAIFVQTICACSSALSLLLNQEKICAPLLAFQLFNLFFTGNTYAGNRDSTVYKDETQRGCDLLRSSWEVSVSCPCNHRISFCPTFSVAWNTGNSLALDTVCSSLTWSEGFNTDCGVHNDESLTTLPTDHLQ